MRTKLCVLGAVLGAASVLPGVCMTSAEPMPRTKPGQSRGGVSRQGHRPPEGLDPEPLVPVAVPANPALDEPKHPCELITVMRVPCDSATATCEYSYWECPRNVKPLSA
jgi:hypothetical protein